MPFYLIQGLDFSPSKSGLIIIIVPGLYSIISLVTGRLSDKLGTLLLCTLGLALTSISFFLLIGLDASATTIDIIWRLFIMGIGMGLFVSPNTSAIMGSVPIERLGTGAAMVGTSRQVGMSLGMAISGSVFTASQLASVARLTSSNLSEYAVVKLSTISGFHDAMVLIIAFVILATVVSVLRGRKKGLAVLE
jgi:MFS family permease